MKKTRLLALCLAVTLLAGCSSPQQDSVEDPLNAFNIDAVVPFATAAPEAVATATPKPTQEEKTPTAVEQLWHDDVLSPTATPQPSTQTSSYSLLMRGDSGENVTNLQQRLAELGYYTGTVDGDFGTGTVNAVKAFEAALGQTQTGVASSSLQRKLYADTAPVYSGSTSTKSASTTTTTTTTTETTTTTTTTSSGYTMLKKGDSGSKVSKLQDRLKELGYYEGSVDGDYGSATVNAVKKFQKALGVEQTGTATAALQKKIYASSAPTYTATATATPSPTAASSGYTELSKGDAGSAVRKLQKRLKALGYYTGEVDGDYGSATVSAVKKFEAAYGKTQTGIATVSLQKKLYSDSALVYDEEDEEEEETTTYTTLSPGDTGDAVKNLQKRLKALGYFDGDIGGNYLTKTTTAVKAFQKAVGLEQTGIATVALQKKLFSDSAPKASSATATPAPQSGYTTLSRGDNNDAVKSMQQRLTDLGYYDGPINGNFGAKTEKAVMKFEAAYGKTQTGVATASLQKELYKSTARVYTEDTPDPEPTEATYKTLKRNSSGTAVKTMQQRLTDLGYYSGPVNGNFGALTEAAVLLFQQALGMEGTGVATAEMQEILYDDDAPGVSSENSADGENALRKGDEGDAVTKLQKRLVSLGYLTSISSVTQGVYDAKTMNAVIDAQLDRDVETDGVATEDFLEYIYSDEAEKLVKKLYG